MGRIKNLIRNINYLTKHSLWDQREEDIVYLTDKILDDGFYEYELLNRDDKLNILSKMQTLQLIKSSPKSFIRTGDGEIKLMMGYDQPFQKYEKEIAEILKRTLTESRDDLYVGINSGYFIPLYNKSDNDKRFYRRMAYDYRKFYYSYCNKNTTYIDATFTSVDLEYNGTEESDNYFGKLKSLFNNKKLAIVSGKGIIESLQYNIFSEADDIIRIDAPKINAWDEHENIIKTIHKMVSKEYIIVFILGMAGKAMIPELTDSGYMCWDVGHLARYYDENKKKTVFSREERARLYAPE